MQTDAISADWVKINVQMVNKPFNRSHNLLVRGSNPCGGTKKVNSVNYPSPVEVLQNLIIACRTMSGLTNLLRDNSVSA
jgi:hypothetical protein